MSLKSFGIDAVERLPLPDSVTRAGIAYLCATSARQLAADPVDHTPGFAADMINHPIAEHADAANEQHYELPPEFFELCLGARRKYSCCFYEHDGMSLDEAEIAALERTVSNAGLEDGQTILELGCGWGSLTLFMAERYPNAKITAVSNSAPQRAHIEAQAKARGFSNLTIITADMNVFDTDQRFDRIVSVEMFEHMANWQALLHKARGWIKPEGRAFIHIFTHSTTPYRFDHMSDEDWIGQYFFTGGIMPSRSLISYFGESFSVEEQWQWSGSHYERTALDWLERFDANIGRIDEILTAVYGKDAALWRRRWRLFYLATAGLFGHASGDVWGVTHYRLKPAP